eukprot:TRINITY_DN9506_c0_g1_i1.p1 TRINITY_DN9506_c0_g1~~TRINITY_DN9506_c0_g1_i1.p1  ORF type:complete len:148 (+),score=25.85 TRINITY_DN9506_c0_g1_i1:176-619(+)
MINTKGLFGDTLLHWAIMGRQDKAVKKLVVEWGADVNLTARNFADSHTPLHLAASLGSEQMLKALLTDKKPSSGGSSHSANLNARTLVGGWCWRGLMAYQCGETPLHKAAMAGKDLNVKRLLEMTADINAVDNVGSVWVYQSVQLTS